MKEEDLTRALGLSTEALQTMIKLIHQVRKQGGQDVDVRLLSQEKILERVAKVLARAGRLTRSFDVWMRNGPDSHVKIFFIGLNVASISDLTDRSLPDGCRLATKAELERLLEDYPNILQDEDKLIIVGAGTESIGTSPRHWVITKEKGVTLNYLIPDGDPIGDHFLFATTFD